MLKDCKNHLRPIGDPNVAYLMSDPWVRQGFDPSADKALLPVTRNKGTRKVKPPHINVIQAN